MRRILVTCGLPRRTCMCKIEDHEAGSYSSQPPPAASMARPEMYELRLHYRDDERNDYLGRHWASDLSQPIWVHPSNAGASILSACVAYLKTWNIFIFARAMQPSHHHQPGTNDGNASFTTAIQCGYHETRPIGPSYMLY